MTRFLDFPVIALAAFSLFGEGINVDIFKKRERLVLEFLAGVLFGQQGIKLLILYTMAYTISAANATTDTTSGARQ